MITCECCGKTLNSWTARLGGSNTAFCKACINTPEGNRIQLKRFLQTLENSEYLNHLFKDGVCSDCGLGVEYVHYSCLKCQGPPDNYYSGGINYDNIKSHSFEDGYCQNCGWSYELALRNAKNCPLNPDFNSKHDQNSEKKETNSNKEEKSYTNNSENLSEAIRYGQILGLKGKVTVSDIKLRYKELSKKYHPDRVNNLGSEFIEIAERKMKEINDAYSWFRKNHDF